MTAVTSNPTPTESGYCVEISSVDPQEGRRALAELAARQELAEAQRDAERRIAEDDPYAGGLDRDGFRGRYGV